MNALRSHPKNNVVDFRGRSRETKEEVLERLFNEHGTAVRSFLRVRMGFSDDLDDVMQDMYIRLANMDDLQSRLPPTGGDSNRSFMFTVANNLALDLERKKSVRRKYADQRRAEAGEESELHDMTPERLTQVNRDMDWLKSELKNMKSTWRQAFLLNRFMHKSYKETAVEMGVTVKQVERFMKSALTHIQKAAVKLRSAEAVREDKS